MAITRIIKAKIPSWLENKRLKLILQKTVDLRDHKKTLHGRLHERWPVCCNQCSQLTDEQKCHRTVPVVQREDWKALKGVILTCAEEGDRLDTTVRNSLLY